MGVVRDSDCEPEGYKVRANYNVLGYGERDCTEYKQRKIFGKNPGNWEAGPLGPWLRPQAKLTHFCLLYSQNDRNIK